jgi:hypothetical protein
MAHGTFITTFRTSSALCAVNIIKENFFLAVVVVVVSFPKYRIFTLHEAQCGSCGIIYAIN